MSSVVATLCYACRVFHAPPGEQCEACRHIDAYLAQLHARRERKWNPQRAAVWALLLVGALGVWWLVMSALAPALMEWLA